MGVATSTLIEPNTTCNVNNLNLIVKMSHIFQEVNKHHFLSIISKKNV